MISRTVSILGSTGSIGTQALDVIGRNRDRFTVRALAAGGNIDLLARQAVEFDVPFVARGGRQRRGPALRARLVCRGRRPRGIRTWRWSGRTPLMTAAAIGADVVLNGITGRSACARPSPPWRPARPLPGEQESLIIGGDLVRAAARPDQIVPVDSEHSAIAQSLRGGRREEVRRLVVTASGDPFRGWSREQLREVTPEQALAHPNYAMGKGHHHELGDPGQQRAWRSSGAPALRRALLCHRRRRAPAAVDSLDGRVPRRLDHRPDGTATDARADRARPVLAGSPRRHRRAVRLVARTGLGVPSARRRRLPRRPAGAAGGEAGARPRRRSTTPPTRCVSRPSMAAGSASSTSSTRWLRGRGA